MNTDAIRAGIDLSGQPLPVATLLAAHSQPDALSATVAALLDQAANSKTLLLEEEEDLIVLGLLALAGVRRSELCQP
ncbi:MAG: hypothetical protein ACREF3_00115, partial [Acetobacteraceae bacterium]